MSTFAIHVRTSFSRRDDRATREMVIDALRVAVEQAAEEIWAAQDLATKEKGVFPYIVVSRYEDDDLMDQMSK